VGLGQDVHELDLEEVARTGACTPWISGADVAAMQWVKEASGRLIEASKLNEGELAEICALCATAASDAMYEASGRVFTGSCGPVTVRPVCFRR